MKTTEEAAWEAGIECDISRDRVWDWEFNCALHGTRFRSYVEPVLCSFGMGYVAGFAAARNTRDAIKSGGTP